MTTRLNGIGRLAALAAWLGATGLVLAQGPGGPPAGGAGQGMAGGLGRGMMHDPAHRADMEVFHQLLDHGAKIRRQVTRRPDGVEAVTESDDPALARAIQTHVSSMSARVKEARPIHQRDPLFREVFAHAARITMTYESTATGVRVVETSTDPYVVKLIQAHADVVSAFIAHGRAEAMKDHAVPPR